LNKERFTMRTLGIALVVGLCALVGLAPATASAAGKRAAKHQARHAQKQVKRTKHMRHAKHAKRARAQHASADRQLMTPNWS
jgi:hypothetical protein